MSFRLLLRIIEAEAGDEAAQRIEQRCRSELGATKIYIGTRAKITADDVHAAAPGDPARAALRLGISRATAYRRLVR